MGNSNSEVLNSIGTDSQIILDGEDVSVERAEGGIFKKGEFVKSGIVKHYFARCSVQPVSGKDLLNVEENDRNKEILKLFTAFKIQKKDVIIRDGKRYEIKNVKDWTSYTRSLAVLIDVE